MKNITDVTIIHQFYFNKPFGLKNQENSVWLPHCLACSISVSVKPALSRIVLVTSENAWLMRSFICCKPVTGVQNTLVFTYPYKKVTYVWCPWRPACRTISADLAPFDANRWFSEILGVQEFTHCRATKSRILTNRPN